MAMPVLFTLIGPFGREVEPSARQNRQGAETPGVLDTQWPVSLAGVRVKLR